MTFMKLGRLLRPSQLVNKPDLEVLSVYREHGVILKSSRHDNFNKTPENLERYLVVRRGDLVINKMKAWSGSVGVSAHEGIVSGDYLVCSVSDDVDSMYLHHVLRSPRFIGEMRSRSRGIRPNQERLYWEDLAQITIPVPSAGQQRRIADFLDDQVSRIDRVISLRGEQVSGLDERLSIQVDAIDEIDAPWVRASRLLTVLPGNAFPSEMFSTSEADIRLLRGVNVGVGLTRWDETVYWPRRLAGALRAFRLQVGDVVLGMDRPWISSGLRIAAIRSEDLPAMLLQRVALLRPGPGLDRRFMLWTYRSRRFRAEVEDDLTGLSVPHLSGPQIEAFDIRLPHLSMQTHIAERLDELERDSCALKAAIERQVSLLSERKWALITAAVTGEFDVTAASGRGLPDSSGYQILA